MSEVSDLRTRVERAIEWLYATRRVIYRLANPADPECSPEIPQDEKMSLERRAEELAEYAEAELKRLAAERDQANERAERAIEVSLRAEAERDRLKEQVRFEQGRIELEWSDRRGMYHPSQFVDAVIACALDHSYDRTANGIPYGMPAEYERAFAPVVERHLSAINPAWQHHTIYMNTAQKEAFRNALKAALPAPPEEREK